MIAEAIVSRLDSSEDISSLSEKDLEKILSYFEIDIERVAKNAKLGAKLALLSGEYERRHDPEVA